MTADTFEVEYEPAPKSVAVMLVLAFVPVELETNVAVQVSVCASTTVNVVGATVSPPAVALLFAQETVEELVIRSPPYSTLS